MEENKKMEELLEKIDNSEKQQRSYAKWQFIMSVITAVSCFGIFCVAVMAYQAVVPTVRDMMPVAQEMIPMAQHSLESISTVAENLNEISSQLISADLAGLVEHVDHMAVASEESLLEALETINAINIEELNTAIRSLSDVVTPLANLMGRFN